MTEEEFTQILAKQVQKEVERQLAPVMTEVLQVLKALRETDDQKKHPEEQRRQTMFWQLQDIRRLIGDDPAALPDKP